MARRPPPASQTSTGHTPSTNGGHRPLPRPWEVASTPPSLNQRRSRFGSRPGEGPPGPLLPLSHHRYPTERHLRCRWGRRPMLRPGEAMGMPSDLKQGQHGSRTPWPPPRLIHSLSAQSPLSLSLSSSGMSRGLTGASTREDEGEGCPRSPFKHPRDASAQGDREPHPSRGDSKI